ncbi:MAG: hypothetical protein QOI85_1890 [Chloroflexota bacterium]|nr:hypothetical protein [Chloroflexota bacterium]
MSGQFIGYPTGWILGVIDDPSDAAEVEAELAGAGIGGDDRMVLTGAEGAKRLDGLGSQSGFLARMRRATQYLAMDQMPDFLMYEVALRDGHTVVGVRPDDADRTAAVEVLKRYGGHFINRFGAWSTEEVLPWRGPMPEIPQLMRR